MRNIFAMMILLGLVIINNVNAQEEKLVIKPAGRILLDAGLMDGDYQNDKLNDGCAIPDIRIGLGAKYGQWSAKIDVGYAYAKVSMKDVFIQYKPIFLHIITLFYAFFCWFIIFGTTIILLNLKNSTSRLENK